jgi:hypothetical protein
MMKTSPFLRQSSLRLAAVLLVSACQAPDVSGEIKAFADAEKAVHAPLKKVLDDDLATARAARITYLITKGLPTYNLGEQCETVFSVEGVGQPCIPIEQFDHDKRMIRLELAQQLLSSLEGYIDAISMLAGSKAPEDIAASIPVLTGDIKAMAAATDSKELKTAGATIDRFSSALSIVARMGSEGARAATLRRVVRDGDSAVNDAVQSLIAVLEAEGDTQFGALFQEAKAASDALDQDPVTENPVRYRAAVTRFEKATAALGKESQYSLAGRLMAVRRTHAALAERLSAGATLAEILQFTKELAQLRAAIDAAKE